MIGSFLAPYCIHCQSLSKKIFCKECQELIELIDPKARCTLCFRISDREVCHRCRIKRTPYVKASLFEKEGPFVSLYKEMRRGKFKRYQKALESYFLIQLEHLQWNFDCLTTPYVSPIKRLFEGKEMTEEIASGIAKKKGVTYSPLFSVFRKRLFEHHVFVKKPVKKRKVLILSMYPLKRPYFNALIQAGAKVYSLMLFDAENA